MKNLIFLIFQDIQILPGTPVFDSDNGELYGLTVQTIDEEKMIPFNLIYKDFKDIQDYLETNKEKNKVHT